MFHLWFAIFLPLVHCANVTLHWNITWIDKVNVAGFTRRVIGVNGKFPIPPVFATENDTLVIYLRNELQDAVALHSHGLYHNRTPYNDGAAMITECGVAPNTEEVKVIPLQQHGTYWLHGHHGGHYVDGLRTPLIIRPLNYKLSADGEFIVGLYDWYNKEHHVLLEHFLSIFNPTGAEPVPDLALINGKTDEIFEVKPASRYIFRVVSMSAFTTFTVSVPDHHITIIEVDGESVEPKIVDEFVIAVAQRYSFILETKNTTKYNYQLLAVMDTGMFDKIPPTLISNVTALIQYHDNATLYTGPSNTKIMLDEMSLHPVVPLEVIQPKQRILFTVSFDLYENATNHGAFNHTVLSYHLVPPLYSAITMGKLAQNATIYGPYNPTFVLDHLDGIELVIQNDDTNEHPFHLHGHKFQVIYQGSGTYNETLVKDYLQNVTNPVRRDTVITAGNGYSVIRWVADNPGAWIFHCHIEWHLESGLGAVFVEAPIQLQERVTLPEPSIRQCIKLGKKATGNAMGYNDSVTFPGLKPFLLYPSGFGVGGSFVLAGCILPALLGILTVVWYARG